MSVSTGLEVSQRTEAESTVFSSGSAEAPFIDFSKLNLLGREDELGHLQDVYKHVQLGGSSRKAKMTSSSSRNDNENENETSIVMVRGLSGTGKSTLVKQFMDDIDRRSQFPGGPIKPFFLYGKYDDLSGDDPFSALVDAFSDFANMLVEGGNKDELERVRKDINDSLGDEANYLTTVVPALRKVISDSESDYDLGSKENAFNRIKYLFQKFTNAISTKTRPVVMVLEDLQWCDKASAQLLQALLTDYDLKYLLFIGSYRSDEVVQDNSFYDCLRVVSVSQRIKQIKLVNLSIEELGGFISDALNIDVKEAETLIQLVFKKTKGNIFFAKQVLDELHRKGFLEISQTTFRWEWHLDNCDLDNILSDDVLQAVTAKLQSSSERLQRALLIAAYTRSTIDFDTLQKLMELDGCPVKAKVLIKILDKAVLDGYLQNSMGSKSYSFTNDRIQQAGRLLVEGTNANFETHISSFSTIFHFSPSALFLCSLWSCSLGSNARFLQINHGEEII